MNSLIIFIGKDKKFDLDETIAAISSIPGISNPQEGSFGQIFECEYEAMGSYTRVGISLDLGAIYVEGLGDESIKFMLELQSRLSVDLYVIDTGYDFDIPVRSVSTIEEFKRAIVAEVRHVER